MSISENIIDLLAFLNGNARRIMTTIIVVCQAQPQSISYPFFFIIPSSLQASKYIANKTINKNSFISQQIFTSVFLKLSNPSVNPSIFFFFFFCLLFSNCCKAFSLIEILAIRWFHAIKGQKALIWQYLSLLRLATEIC